MPKYCVCTHIRCIRYFPLNGVPPSLRPVKKKKLLITKSSPHLLKGIAILLKIICGYCCKVLQLKDICKATVSPWSAWLHKACGIPLKFGGSSARKNRPTPADLQYYLLFCVIAFCKNQQAAISESTFHIRIPSCTKNAHGAEGTCQSCWTWLWKVRSSLITMRLSIQAWLL